MDYVPEYTLRQTIDDLEDAAAALQIFADNVPDEADISRYMEDLLTLAEALVVMDRDFPDEARLSRVLEKDISLLLSSLNLTLERLRDMFRNTRFRKYNGSRPYRRAWEDFCHDLREEERIGLGARIDTYSMFVKNILDNLKRRPVDRHEIRENRERLEKLLELQEEAEESSDDGLDDLPPGPPPPIGPNLPHLPNIPPYPTLPNGPVPPWWEEWDPRFYPPAPDAPLNGFGGASSPTLSSTTYSSWSSDNSTNPRPPPTRHWAQAVLNGRHPQTVFHRRGQPTQCFGAPDAGLLNRLHRESFYEVSRLTFESSNVIARFWWRPQDNRSRILLQTTDQFRQSVNFCLPLTALKLVRRGPTLQLHRMNRDVSPPRLDLWAVLSFSHYERLVLFYCVWSALKAQDYRHCRPNMQDYFHRRASDRRQQEEEEELFGGQIEDGGYLHALRVFRDADSGGVRLEARACRGPMKRTPIWTAFVTKEAGERGWVVRTGPKTVLLGRLKPYVFNDGYTPLKGQTREVELKFSERDDAGSFMDVVRFLRERV